MNRILLAASLATACGARTVEGEVGVDAALDAAHDVAAETRPDAGAMPEADPEAPIPNTYPAEGGSCLVSKCFGADEHDAFCNTETGWCCAGMFTPSGCRCGESRGCIPPYVCCRLPGEVIRECKPISECPWPS